MVLNESANGQEFSVSLPNYQDWKRDNNVFKYLAITRRESRNLSGIPGQEAERIQCAYVSEEFFSSSGCRPNWDGPLMKRKKNPAGRQLL